MPCLRHTSTVFAPASCSLRSAIICSSLNRLRFIIRPSTRVGLYSNLDEFHGLRSCTLGALIFIRQTRNVHREPFDFVGFLTLSLAIGALQLMLDRGELKDWFHSSEIWIEAMVAGLGFYLFAVHTVTT